MYIQTNFKDNLYTKTACQQRQAVKSPQTLSNPFISLFPILLSVILFKTTVIVILNKYRSLSTLLNVVFIQRFNSRPVFI